MARQDDPSTVIWLQKTMPWWRKYDHKAVGSPTTPARQLGHIIRRHHGNSAKRLRRQIGPNYDVKKVRNSYWRWPQRELAGNTIDFFVQVLGLSFNDAMRQITGRE